MRRFFVAAALVLAALAPAACGPSARSIEVRMRYSKFLPAAISVTAGETVEFVLVNADPIEHEFVIGTEAEQLAHERGDPHDPHAGPGEAILAANETTRVRYTFRNAGALLYACHRAGHYAFGMRGAISVEA